jgi:hypothetical protein
LRIVCCPNVGDLGFSRATLFQRYERMQEVDMMPFNRAIKSHNQISITVSNTTFLQNEGLLSIS